MMLSHRITDKIIYIEGLHKSSVKRKEDILCKLKEGRCL